MFHWTRLTAPAADVAEFAKRAVEKLLAFVLGVPSYATNPDRATLHLSFATSDLVKIEEGVGRLAKAL